MRAKEFITEIKLDVPNQMVSVQIPLSDLVAVTGEPDPTVKVNPGKRAGDDGKYKWSPPLQQHLDSVKDSVGPSNDEITTDDSDAEEIEDAAPRRSAKNTALISKIPSVLG